MRALLPALGIAAALAACTTDDPREGGLVGGLVGLGSGTYERRIVEETEALETEKLRHRDEAEAHAMLSRDRSERRELAAELELELSALHEQVDKLDVEIAALRRREAVTQDDVAKAEADVAALLDDIDRIEAERDADERARALGADAGRESDPAAFGEPPKEQVSDLRAYIDRLQKAIDALKETRERHAGEAEMN